MRTKTLAVIIAAGLALLTSACGGGGDNASSDTDGVRRVDVAMVDIDYTPKTLEVAKGEEVRFVFRNKGKVRHEAYFGSPAEQADHAETMAEGGAISGGHNAHGGSSSGSSDKITVEPGKSGDITYRFDEAGAFEIGCHEPGHYAGGMKITVNVT